MRRAPRVAVIGAGVVGLAATDALCRAGAEVRCFEKAVPGHAESIGLTRIFRHAHGNPALVRVAMRAGAGWCAWERRFGRRLLGAEGLIITGDTLAPAWERALREAGAPCQALDPAAFTDRLPIAQPPPAALLWDPAGGAIRARRIIEALRQSVAGHIVPAEVLGLASSETGARVRTADDTWACDEALVTAGIDTPGLAAQVGVQAPTALIRHARLTFAPVARRENGRSRAGSTRATPTGTTSRPMPCRSGRRASTRSASARAVTISPAPWMSRRSAVAARRWRGATSPPPYRASTPSRSMRSAVPTIRWDCLRATDSAPSAGAR